MTQLSSIVAGFFGDYTNGNYSYVEVTASGSQNIPANTPTVVQFPTVLQDTDLIFSTVTNRIVIPLSMNNANAVLTSSLFSNDTAIVIETSFDDVTWSPKYRSFGEATAILRLQTGMQIRVVAENPLSITVPVEARLSMVILNATLEMGSSTANVQTGFEQQFLLMGG